MRKPGKKPAANTEYQLRIRRDRGMRGVEWGPRACPCAAWGNAFKSNLGTRAHFCPTPPPPGKAQAHSPPRIPLSLRILEDVFGGIQRFLPCRPTPGQARGPHSPPRIPLSLRKNTAMPHPIITISPPTLNELLVIDRSTYSVTLVITSVFTVPPDASTSKSALLAKLARAVWISRKIEVLMATPVPFAVPVALRVIIAFPTCLVSFRPSIVAVCRNSVGCKGSGKSCRCAFVATILVACIIKEPGAVTIFGLPDPGVVVGVGVGVFPDTCVAVAVGLTPGVKVRVGVGDFPGVGEGQGHQGRKGMQNCPEAGASRVLAEAKTIPS